jgi:hypothetical protein
LIPKPTYCSSPSPSHIPRNTALTHRSDIITDLNDTRPIVNDRVHKQIMAGGGWVYQILKDLAEEKEEDGEDEEVDVEGVCGELRGWVDGEFARVG